MDCGEEEKNIVIWIFRQPLAEREVSGSLNCQNFPIFCFSFVHLVWLGQWLSIDNYPTELINKTTFFFNQLSSVVFLLWLLKFAGGSLSQYSVDFLSFFFPIYRKVDEKSHGVSSWFSKTFKVRSINLHLLLLPRRELGPLSEEDYLGLWMNKIAEKSFVFNFLLLLSLPISLD